MADTDTSVPAAEGADAQTPAAQTDAPATAPPDPAAESAREAADLKDRLLRSLAERAKSGTAAEEFKAAPRFAPRRRLDETLAARKPVLRWRPSNNPPEGDPMKQAAE